MGKVIWHRITVDQMAFLKGRKRAWKEKREEMLKLQAKATKAASINKQTRREALISVCLSMLPQEPMTTRQLWIVLDRIYSAMNKGEKKSNARKLKALRMTLSRYHVVRYDETDGLWKVKVA